MSRCYMLAKRGLSSSGEIEMIYKTNIPISEIEGSEIENIERLLRGDLMSAIGLSRYSPLFVVVDMKDETISVVLRPHNGDPCKILKSYIEIEEND